MSSNMIARNLRCSEAALVANVESLLQGTMHQCGGQVYAGRPLIVTCQPHPRIKTVIASSSCFAFDATRPKRAIWTVRRQVMKESKGRANPAELNRLLMQRLNESS